jgi:membrane protein implicated in regulation of membrane protease activity
MWEWLDLSSLQCVYFALIGIGVVYAIFILVSGGGDADIDVGGGDIDVDTLGSFDHGEIGINPLSPVTIASFVTAFGAWGIIAINLLRLSAEWSILVALVGAVVIAALASLAYSFFLIAPQGSSEVRSRDIVGAKGEIITPIAAGKVGEVALVARGTRITSAARSVDGSEIPRGSIVRVTEIVGSVVLVERFQSGSTREQSE